MSGSANTVAGFSVVGGRSSGWKRGSRVSRVLDLEYPVPAMMP